VPIGNIIVARVEVPGVLTHKKSANQRYEEHEIARKGKEKA
jgi:hypothetical protein